MDNSPFNEHIDDQSTRDSEYVDNSPKPSVTELDNGQIIETPPANLAVAKGTYAAAKKVASSDSRDIRVGPHTVVEPEITSEGPVHDEPLLHRRPVFTADGERLGSVSDRPSLRDHLIMQHGKLFTSDLYIPRTAIERIDDNGVYLNVTRDQVDSLGWDAAPEYR